MLRWIKLEDLFKNPSRWPDPEKLYIGYTPVMGKITITPVDTGKNLYWKYQGKEESMKEEIMETQFHMAWHPHLTKDGKVILISTRATWHLLTIYGKQGCKNVYKLMQKIGLACYSNESLGAKGGCVTPDIFNELSEYQQKLESNTYVLGMSPNEGYSLLLYGNSTGDVNAHAELHSYSMLSSDRELSHFLFVRPCVKFTGDILVNVRDKRCDGSKPDCALEIQLAENFKEPTLSSLMDRIDELEEMLEENEKLHADVKQLLSGQEEIKRLLHYIANNMQQKPYQVSGSGGFYNRE